MNKVVIMQPYFLPYLGYFQLMKSADTFVFLDNVNYINRGWVNRNQFLFSGVPNMFTIPLIGASQNKLICEIEIADGRWTKTFFRSLEMNYRKSKNFEEVMTDLKEVIGNGLGRISDLNQKTTLWCCEQLQISTSVMVSSLDFSTIDGVGQDRIIGICKLLEATGYNNAIGGIDLYDKGVFSEHGIELSFVKSYLNPYQQTTVDFHPGMSILDVLMNNDREERSLLLSQYELL